MNAWTNIKAIMKRELGGYFTSPVAYVFLVIFLLLTGFFTFTVGNNEKYIGDRRSEITAELAFHDRFDVGPCTHYNAPFTVSGSVMLRKTSSSRPSSTWISSSFQFSRCASSAMLPANAPLAPRSRG